MYIYTYIHACIHTYILITEIYRPYWSWGKIGHSQYFILLVWEHQKSLNVSGQSSFQHTEATLSYTTTWFHPHCFDLCIHPLDTASDCNNFRSPLERLLVWRFGQFSVHGFHPLPTIPPVVFLDTCAFAWWGCQVPQPSSLRGNTVCSISDFGLMLFYL